MRDGRSVLDSFYNMPYNIPSVTVIGAAVPVLLSLVIYMTYITFLQRSRDRLLCNEDLRTGNMVCRPSCEHGYFSLPGLDRCHRWLDCEAIDSITRGEVIGHGIVKMVIKGQWHDHDVAVNILQNDRFREDFFHGLNMIRHFQPRDHVVQFIGWCRMTYVTQFHRLGSANNLESVLQSQPYQKYNTILKRFQICISYVKAIHFLHTSPMGKRVMCDSNDPNKTLSQFLLSPNLDLVLNDLDALPEMKSEVTVKCGHRELTGDYVAPEQLWPFDETDFDDSRMPGYDEKTDIWKIPDICDVILGPGIVSLRLHLLEIHAKCKEEDPTLRPSADQIFWQAFRTYCDCFMEPCRSWYVDRFLGKPVPRQAYRCPGKIPWDP